MSTNLAYQDDFQEECREELINGEVVAMSPSPGWNHVSIAGNIYGIFRNYLIGKKCVPIPDGFDLHLTKKEVFIPDMMVVCDQNKIKPDGVHGAPDLVVEVLSPSTMRNDKTSKKQIYAACGVREYWLVSPGDKSVEIYYLNGTEFALHNIYTLHPSWELEKMSEEELAAVETHFKCSLFDDLDISLDDIFYRTF